MIIIKFCLMYMYVFVINVKMFVWDKKVEFIIGVCVSV